MVIKLIYRGFSCVSALCLLRGPLSRIDLSLVYWENSKKKNNKRTDLDDLNLRPSTGKASEDAPFLVPIQLARRMETNLSSEKQRNLEKLTQP